MDKNKLWCFGDSFTAGDGCVKSPKENPYSETTKAYRKYLNKQDGEEILIYPDYVSAHFDLELINIATGGASNEMILAKLYENIKLIKKNDYVIIGFSYFERFDLLINNIIAPTNVGSISTSSDELFQKSGLSRQGVFEVILNRNKPLFKERWVKEISGIKYLLNSICDNACIWTHDDDLLLESFKQNDNKLFLIPEDETKFSDFMGKHKMAIMQETNGVIADGHFGEKAHKFWADLIIKHFENGTK